MIDLTQETLVRLTEAAHIINPHRPPSLGSVWRWALRGVRQNKLESLVIGAVRYTSREAIIRFIARGNAVGAVVIPPTAAAIEAGRRLQA